MLNNIRKSIGLKALYFLLCIIFGATCNNSIVHADGTVADKLAQSTKDAIYNLDTDQIVGLVAPFLSGDSKITAVKIIDALDNSILYEGYRHDQGDVVIDRIPDDILAFQKFEKEVVFEGERIGVVEVYSLNQSPLDLTLAEQRWLAQNPEITIGVEDWFPFIRSDGKGGFEGIAGDFLGLVLDKTGLKARVIPDIWATLLSDFKNGDIDLLPATYFTKERAQFGRYSIPYFSGREFLYVRSDNTEITDFESLKGKRLAIQESFGTIPKIKEKFPEIEIVLAASQVDTIYAVLEGRADATFEQQIVMEQVLLRELITGIKSVPQSTFEAPDIYFFSHQEKPLLASILSKGLASISERERNQIVSKWLGVSQNTLNTNQLETNFVKKETSNVVFKIALISLGLLLALGATLFVLGRTQKKKDLSQLFSSKVFSSCILVGLSLLVATVTVMNGIAIDNKKESSAEKVTRELQIVLNNSIDRIAVWIKDRQAFLVQLGRDQYLVDSIQDIEENKSSWPNAKQLADIRTYISSSFQLSTRQYKIISLDGTILLDREINDIGSLSPLLKLHPDLIDQVFTGQSVFIPPVTSMDHEKANISPNDIPHDTMYFVAPIIGFGGQVVAAFLEQVLAEDALSSNLRLSRVGASGETYAVTPEGKMLTESRFKNDLFNMGFKQKGTSELIDIDVREPGGNMTTGFQSQIPMMERPFTFMMQDVLRLRENGLGYELGQSRILDSATHPFNVIGYPDYRGVLVVGAWTWLDELGFGITSELDHVEAYQDFENFRENLILISSVATVLAIATTLFTLLIGQRSQKSLRQANEQLEDRVEERTHELKDAYEIISGSISYASHIQQSVLPDMEPFSGPLRDHFIIWEPRDKVGGDIYWCDFWGDGIHLTLADCTGHGVPGAFVTLLATGAFEKSKNEVMTGDLQGVISAFHKNLQFTLGQDTDSGKTDDGLELGSCYINPEMTKMQFVGARFDLYIIENGTVEIIKGMKKGLGYRKVPKNQFFEGHEIDLKPGRRFYMTSDGLIDQVGGERRIGFGKKRFMALLLKIQHHCLTEQKQIILNELMEYQGNQMRRDDLSVIGFEVSPLDQRTQTFYI